MDNHGNFTVSLFDIFDQQDADQFFYFYLALDRPIKKIFENAFYQAYTKQLLDNEKPAIIHHEEDGVTHIEVNPKDILSNIEIIKKIIEAGVIED